VAWIQASLALFAYPAVTSGEEGCDLAFLNTLLTGRVRAREGRQRSTTELSSTREQCEYKRGETRTFPQSPLSQHRQQSLRQCCRFLYRWRTNRGPEESYERWRIVLMEAGPLLDCWAPVQGGWKYWAYEEETLYTQRWILLDGFIKTRMGLIINGGTFSKCGLPTTQYHIQSFFSSMHISCTIY